MENCKHCGDQLIPGKNLREYLIKRKSKICSKCRYLVKKRTKYYVQRKRSAVFSWAKDELESRLFRKFNDVAVSAARRGIEFSITKEYFVYLTRQSCFYCGDLSTKTNPSGLDRVLNKIGYTQDNVVPCCKFCNFGKNQQSVKQYLDRCERVATNSATRGGL